MDVKADVAAPQQRRRRKAQLLLLLRGAIKKKNYLTSASLQDPLNSVWKQLYDKKLPCSFIADVSLPPAAFDLLLAKFDKFYKLKLRPGQRGRPPKLRFVHAVLDCVLHYYMVAVEKKTLCEIFGIPPATLSTLLAKAEVVLELALNELPDAAVRYSTKNMQITWRPLLRRASLWWRVYGDLSTERTIAFRSLRISTCKMRIATV